MRSLCCLTPMTQAHLLQVSDQRSASSQLYWLTLEAPQLARSVRPGQYLLLRCADAESHDPMLRRALYVASAEPALGQIGLIYQANDRGLRWLSRLRAGDTLDVLGPFGQGFTLDKRSRTLLLIGQGPGLAALLFYAKRASEQHCAVTLYAGAEHHELLPPPFLLPSEVEYQSAIQLAEQDLNVNSPSAISGLSESITWADQIGLALPEPQLIALRDSINKIKYRWTQGYASALLDGPIICGVGACQLCNVELRKRQRKRCSDGPVFDLRDLL